MTGRPSILVVDDEPASAQYMMLALGEQYEHVRTAPDGVQALLRMEEQVPDLVISDLNMPNMDGLELLTLLKQRWPEVPFILVTVEQEVSTVVQAVQRGASNYLVKPVAPAPLLDAVGRALRSSAERPSADATAPELVGVSPAMVRVRHLLTLTARSDVNVLITGSTGTGKELVSRAIHRLSALSEGPFVACNCALVPPDLFESEFFGHRRGAFTGADRDHVGLLQQSHGGILLLDELECMSLPHQAKLLRVLDDGEVRPVGSQEPVRVSVRYLAATNRDPLSMTAEGSLREDLYYRLRGFEIRLPPLRDRAEDIGPLAAHFLEGQADALTPEALTALSEYSWPGNVRQLRNVLRSAQAAAGDGPIGRRHLVLEAVGGVESEADAAAGQAAASLPGGGTLKDVERQAIVQALEECDGNRSRAARALGIDRSTLRRKLQEFGLTERQTKNGRPRAGGR